MSIELPLKDHMNWVSDSWEKYQDKMLDLFLYIFGNVGLILSLNFMNKIETGEYEILSPRPIDTIGFLGSGIVCTLACSYAATRSFYRLLPDIPQEYLDKEIENLKKDPEFKAPIRFF